MTQNYPKRIINFIAACFFILLLLSLVRQCREFISYNSNLTSTDKYLYIAFVLFSLFALISTLAIFKRKKWAWIGITSCSIYSSIVYFIAPSLFDFDILQILIIPVIIIFVLISIFLLSPAVKRYFQLNSFHFLIAHILIGFFSSLVTINPIKDESNVNLYYLEYLEQGYHLNGAIYSGNTFFNYPNGQMEFEGKIINGKEENQWNSYNNDGSLSSISNYKNGLLHGQEIHNFSTGDKEEEFNYFEGQLNGNYERWFSPTALIIKGTYKLNSKHGRWVHYDLDGLETRIEIYKDDTLENVIYPE